MTEIRLILVQFSFANPKNAPPLEALQVVRREDELHAALRSIRRNGVQIIEPVGKVSLAGLLDDFSLARFALTNATYQTRLGGRALCGTYSTVRFEFVHESYAGMTAEFSRKWDSAIASFRKMCTEAMWRVRAYNNPYYNGNQEIPGQRMLSLNLEVREPLLDPQGQPIMIWEKKATADATTRKVPLTPIWSLRFCDGSLSVVERVAA